jgi:hypothetical protein
MAIAYSINGGSEVHGVVSGWENVPVRQDDDGTINYSPLAINRWHIAQMDMTTWETLRAARGDTLTSLETNDIDDRNTGKAYPLVTFERLEGGEQRGQRVLNTIAIFRVDIRTPVWKVVEVPITHPSRDYRLRDKTFRPVWGPYYHRKRAITSQ